MDKEDLKVMIEAYESGEILIQVIEAFIGYIPDMDIYEGVIGRINQLEDVIIKNSPEEMKQIVGDGYEKAYYILQRKDIDAKRKADLLFS
jgi:hypothetical protein